MKGLSLKTMSSPGDDHPVYYIYKGGEHIGAIESYIDPATSTLVVRNFFVDKRGILTKGFLKSIFRLLESKAKSLRMERVGVERKPEHSHMYSVSGFVEAEGDWGNIVSRPVRE